MSIGVFMLHKNEKLWIGPWLENILPVVDQVCLFDGNSDDGSLEIIEHFDQHYPDKIKLVKDKDPKDLKDDYVRLFDECLHSLDTDFAFFLHPDMRLVNPEQVLKIKDSEAVSMSCRVESFGGDPLGDLFRFANGRCSAWKNIYRLRNPDLGLHYHGHYGAQNEDCYFEAITGNEHKHYGSNFSLYPYSVEDSGIIIQHFSDVRPYQRRLDRMVTCLENQGMKPEVAKEVAKIHPRVTLCDGHFNGSDFRFTKYKYPDGFIESQNRWLRYADEAVAQAARTRGAKDIRKHNEPAGEIVHNVSDSGIGLAGTEKEVNPGHPGGY